MARPSLRFVSNGMSLYQYWKFQVDPATITLAGDVVLSTARETRPPAGWLMIGFRRRNVPEESMQRKPLRNGHPTRMQMVTTLSWVVMKPL